MPYELIRTSHGLPAAVTRELSAIERGALVEASRVQAVHFVARVAQVAVADLTAFEEQAAKSSPTCAVRLMTVGDAATSAITARVLRVGMAT